MTSREVGAQMRALGYTLCYDERGRCYIHRPGDPANRRYTMPLLSKDTAWVRAINKYRREQWI